MLLHLRLQPKAILPLSPPLHRSMAPLPQVGLSPSHDPVIPGTSSCFRPVPQKSSPTPDLREIQIRRLAPPLGCSTDWPRSVASPALDLLRRRFRPGESPPSQGSLRQEPAPPDDENRAPWFQLFTAEMPLNQAPRLRVYPETKASSFQQPRILAGDNQLVEAAAHQRPVTVKLGFYGLRCKLVPDLLMKTKYGPWSFLTPANWMWCILVPALIWLSPLGPRITSLMQAPEWLWYKEGFSIAHEDKSLEKEGTVNCALGRE